MSSRQAQTTTRNGVAQAGRSRRRTRQNGRIRVRAASPVLRVRTSWQLTRECTGVPATGGRVLHIRGVLGGIGTGMGMRREKERGKERETWTMSLAREQ